MKKVYAVTYISEYSPKRMTFDIYQSKENAEIVTRLDTLKGCKPKIEVYVKVGEIKPKKGKP